MKHLSILILLIFLTSCCGTKKIVQNAAKPETKEIAQVAVPEVPETPTATEVIIEAEIPETETNEITKPEEPSETVEVVEHETIIENTEAFNHISWNDLLQQYVTRQGNVNYKGFKNERTSLKSYITSLSENMPTDSWSKEDKLAYWINAYNAMTVDLIVRNYPTKSIKDIKDPWDQRLWKLGAKWYNLNEIEHQILRKMNEPRIHFGIVCASFSCPKLLNEAFTALNLEAQLTAATKDFLNDSARNNISKNSIKLSKIFKWFAKDFKQNGSLIDFLNQYSDISISNKAKKSFKDYNWDLNE